MIDQTAFTMLYFESHPNERIDSYDAEETLRHGWFDITGEKFRDPGRKMRELRDKGHLSSDSEGNVTYFMLAKPYNVD